MHQILAGLALRREALVGEVLAEARSLGGYVDLGPSQVADFAQTVREGLDAVLRAMAEQRALGEEDVAFLWAHIRRRTQAGVPEGDMLAVVRLFQRVVWDAIFELAGDDDGGRDAALVLARPLLGHIDVLSQTVGRAFAEAGEAMSLRAGTLRRELIDSLLSGVMPAPGPALELACRVGLHPGATLVVLSAVACAAGEEAELLVGCRTLAGAIAPRGEPLGVVRDGEIVAVAAVSDDELHYAVAAVEAAAAGLASRRMPLAIGISTLRDGPREAPLAHREAVLARSRVGGTGGLLALCELSVADYLILSSGDDTAWRLVPEVVRRFVQEDGGAGSVLSDTTLAYVDCDLNVKLAAERLFVHPNTAHYRLARIEERTRLSMRRLADVLLLATAIRLFRSGGFT